MDSIFWPFEFFIKCFTAFSEARNEPDGNLSVKAAILTRPFATLIALILTIPIFNLELSERTAWFFVAWFVGFLADMAFKRKSVSNNSFITNLARGLALGFMLGVWI